MEPADQGGDNPHQDDDTSMGGGGGGGGRGATAAQSSSSHPAPIKFTYNLLHYPRYPSYEVLLEKRFKTLPPPTTISTTTSELEATPSASSEGVATRDLRNRQQQQQNSSSASIEGAHEGDRTNALIARVEGGGGALHAPGKRKRSHDDDPGEEETTTTQEADTMGGGDGDAEGATEKPMMKKRRKPARLERASSTGAADPVQSHQEDNAMAMMVVTDDADDGEECGVGGGRSPLMTTTRSSSSMELPSVDDAGGAGCQLPLLLGMNGIEPEDRPAEDDCEAEPTQSVEDEHCLPGGAVPMGRGATDGVPSSSSSSSSSSSIPTSTSTSALDTISSSGRTTLASTAACVRRDGMTRDEMKANAVSLDELIEPLEDIRRSTQEVGRSLRSHRFHYNLDMCKLVTGIDRSVTELNAQILSRRRFLEFVLHLDRPVQTNLGYFGALPIELVLHIFGYLDGKDLLRNADVCSTFAALSNDAHLWKNIVERTWDLEGTYMQKPSHKSFKWLFECKKRVFKAGDIKNGKGSWDGEHGDMFEGEWKDNKRHGVGTGLMQDGRRYDGEWENDMRSGFGIFRWPINYAKNGGDLYAGNWKEDQRHGEGIYIWADGTKYEGQWKEGKREGYGCVVWPDGRRYEGEYKDGKMSGKGTFCWPDGSVYVGEYKDGKRHGEGTYTYSTMMGGVYTGQWRNGMRDGWGKLVKNDGEMYQGVWKFNCPFGGVLTRKDGTVIEKFWRLFSPDS